MKAAATTMLACAGMLLSVLAWANEALRPLESVASVDLTRYQGRWYQVAHYPNQFQADCVSDTMADYRLLPDGRVAVTNQCRTASGQVKAAQGMARVAKPAWFSDKVSAASPTRLQVRFAPAWLAWLPAVWGDYWIIQLASDYRYAVVGEPSRQYLWVLARTPHLSLQDWATIRQVLRAQGYAAELLRMEQWTAPSGKGLSMLSPISILITR